MYPVWTNSSWTWRNAVRVCAIRIHGIRTDVGLWPSRLITWVICRVRSIPLWPSVVIISNVRVKFAILACLQNKTKVCSWTSVMAGLRRSFATSRKKTMNLDSVNAGKCISDTSGAPVSCVFFCSCLYGWEDTLKCMFSSDVVLWKKMAMSLMLLRPSPGNCR